MALSRETLDALRHELKLHDAEMGRVEEQLKELTDKRMALHRSKSTIQQLLMASAALNAPNGSRAPPAPPDFASLGFRDAIRAVMRRISKEMMPKEVEAAMLNSGYRDTGGASTPLRIRIGNELFKLARDGEITRGKTGYIAK